MSIAEFKSEIKRWNALLYALTCIDDYIDELPMDERLRACFTDYCEPEDIGKNIESCKKVDLFDGDDQPYDIYGNEGRCMNTLLTHLMDEHKDWTYDYLSCEYIYDFDDNEF